MGFIKSIFGSVKYIKLAVYLTLLFLLPHATNADIRAIVIQPNTLPYDLAPSNYNNSPKNFENSISNYDNSASKYDNSPSNYANSPHNYENGKFGKRRIISEDSTFMGYYVFSNDGIMNFYNSKGKRIAFIPYGGHTKSLFFSRGGWCGTIGNQGNATVLGLTQNCYLGFALDE